jgi:hypothetical protein
MPFYMSKFLLPLAKYFAKSKEDCANYMCESLLNEKIKGGFFIKGEYNDDKNKTNLHNNDSIDFMWDHMTKNIFEKYLK